MPGPSYCQQTINDRQGATTLRTSASPQPASHPPSLQTRAAVAPPVATQLLPGSPTNRPSQPQPAALTTLLHRNPTHFSQAGPPTTSRSHRHTVVFPRTSAQTITHCMHHRTSAQAPTASPTAAPQSHVQAQSIPKPLQKIKNTNSLVISCPPRVPAASSAAPSFAARPVIKVAACDARIPCAASHTNPAP